MLKLNKSYRTYKSHKTFQETRELVATEWTSRPLLLGMAGLLVGMVSTIHVWHIVFLFPFLAVCRNNRAFVALFIGLILGFIRAPLSPVETSAEVRSFQGKAHVIQVPQNTSRGMRVMIESGSSRYLLRVNRDADISFGDLVEVRGEVVPLPEQSAKYWNGQGVSSSIQADTHPRVLRRGWPIWRWALYMRRSFVAYTDSTLDDRAANVVDALCFNVDAELDQGFRDALRRSGTVHIISTSGIHVMIVAVALAWLLQLLPLPRWSLLVVLAAVLLLYAGAAGFRPPAVRAVVMALIVACAYAFRREGDGLSAWAFAASINLLWTPEVIRDIGFQLSFVIVGALVMFAHLPRTEPSDLLGNIGKSVKALLWASVVATLGSAPLVAYAFGQVSLVSIFANLAIELVLTPIMVVALIAWLASSIPGVGPPLCAGLMQVVVEPLTGYLIMMVHVFGDPEWAAIKVPEFNAYWLVLIYGVGILLWRPRSRALSSQH